MHVPTERRRRQLELPKKLKRLAATSLAALVLAPGSILARDYCGEAARELQEAEEGCSISPEGWCYQIDRLKDLREMACNSTITRGYEPPPNGNDPGPRTIYNNSNGPEKAAKAAKEAADRAKFYWLLGN